MVLRWYDMKSKHGTITIKAKSEEQAKEEAAERWNCAEEEIVCTSNTPYYGGRRLFA